MQVKIILLGFGLLFPYFQPTAVQLRTTEIGYEAPVSYKVQPLKLPTIAPAARLEMAAFHFAPMGTYHNSYVPGQCTAGAASMKGNIPNWGNANRWDDGARAAGIEVSSEPVVGAVAQTDRGYYGHVAVVTAVEPGHIDIEEMNYDGLGIGSVRTRAAAPSEFVYILL